jgi:hypothetical protein
LPSTTSGTSKNRSAKKREILPILTQGVLTTVAEKPYNFRINQCCVICYNLRSITTEGDNDVHLFQEPDQCVDSDAVVYAMALLQVQRAL